MLEKEFYQCRVGLFDSEEFEVRKIFWGRIMGRDVNLNTWSIELVTFDPDFRIYMDELLDEIS